MAVIINSHTNAPTRRSPTAMVCIWGNCGVLSSLLVPAHSDTMFTRRWLDFDAAVRPFFTPAICEDAFSTTPKSKGRMQITRGSQSVDASLPEATKMGQILRVLPLASIYLKNLKAHCGTHLFV